MSRCSVKDRTAGKLARNATRSEYDGLMAEGACHSAGARFSQAEKSFRNASALEPHQPAPYFNVGAALNNAGRYAEAVPNFLEAAERFREDSAMWANAIVMAFSILQSDKCSKVAKPEWWNDEGLRTFSQKVVSAMDKDPTRAMNIRLGHQMRCTVLSGETNAIESAMRSAADLKEAAKHAGLAAQLYMKRQGDRFAIALLHQAATLFHKAADMEAAAAETKAAEVGAKALVRAEAEARAKAAADTLLAEEAAETVALAAITAVATGPRSAYAQVKGKGKAKSRCKSSGKR